MSKTYEEGYRDGFRDGFSAGHIRIPNTTPTPPVNPLQPNAWYTTCDTATNWQQYNKYGASR